jgi:hypothetical protein
MSRGVDPDGVGISTGLVTIFAWRYSMGSTTDEKWPETADEIFGGDQCIALGHVTPGQGVVLTPVTNFAQRDRAAGTVSVNSSVGMWKKLQALQRNPKVALAFHTRAHSHGHSARQDYVLVQGNAKLSSLSDPEAWLQTLGENWERFSGESRDVGRLWERWLRAYHWRVNIEVAVERVIVWPDLECRGVPKVYGTLLPAELPATQRPPAKGTGPRVNHTRAAKRAQGLANVLLAWTDAEGYPTIAPVGVTGADGRGILLTAPTELIPDGGRRAGLLAHEFSRHVVGQHQRKHTGWLEVSPAGQGEDAQREIVYAPHTHSGYYLPPSRLLFKLAGGYVSRRGLREARRAGFLDELPPGIRTRELHAAGLRTCVLDMRTDRPVLFKETFEIAIWKPNGECAVPVRHALIGDPIDPRRRG